MGLMQANSNPPNTRHNVRDRIAAAPKPIHLFIFHPSRHFLTIAYHGGAVPSIAPSVHSCRILSIHAMTIDFYPDFS